LSVVDQGVRAEWPVDILGDFYRLTRACLNVTTSQRLTVVKVFDMLQEVLSKDFGRCVMCYMGKTTARLQCGHLLLCQLCEKYALERATGCPLCHAPLRAKGEGVDHFTTFVPL